MQCGCATARVRCTPVMATQSQKTALARGRRGSAPNRTYSELSPLPPDATASARKRQRQKHQKRQRRIELAEEKKRRDSLAPVVQSSEPLLDDDEDDLDCELTQPWEGDVEMEEREEGVGGEAMVGEEGEEGVSSPSCEGEGDKSQVDEGTGEQWHKSGSAWIGRRVARVFEGEVMRGTVMAWLPPGGDLEQDPPLWRVHHDDGDCEDLDEAELIDAFVAFQAALDSQGQQPSGEPQVAVSAKATPKEDSAGDDMTFGLRVRRPGATEWLGLQSIAGRGLLEEVLQERKYTPSVHGARATGQRGKPVVLEGKIFYSPSGRGAKPLEKTRSGEQFDIVMAARGAKIDDEESMDAFVAFQAAHAKNSKCVITYGGMTDTVNEIARALHHFQKDDRSCIPLRQMLLAGCSPSKVLLVSAQTAGDLKVEADTVSRLHLYPGEPAAAVRTSHVSTPIPDDWELVGAKGLKGFNRFPGGKGSIQYLLGFDMEFAKQAQRFVKDHAASKRESRTKHYEVRTSYISDDGRIVVKGGHKWVDGIKQY